MSDIFASDLGTTEPSSVAARAVGTSHRARRRRERVLLHLGQLGVLILVLVAWELVSGSLVPTLFISTPGAVAERLWEWAGDGSLWSSASSTVLLAVTGFSIGAVAGAIFGFVVGSSDLVSRLLKPFITVAYSIPRLALAPVFILWFGIGTEFKISFAVVIVFFLVFFNTYAGVRDVSSELVDMLRLCGASRIGIMRRVTFPSALVWIVAGLRISVPYAFVGVVVAEMLVGTGGLGRLLYISSATFDSAGTFAAIAILGAVGVLLDSLVSAASTRALRWKTKGVSHGPV